MHEIDDRQLVSSKENIEVGSETFQPKSSNISRVMKVACSLVLSW